MKGEKMYRFIILLCTTILISACQTTGKRPANFDNPETTNVGIVFMHGSKGGPYDCIPGLTSALSNAGFMVIAPTMPWSNTSSGGNTLQIIEKSINTLREAGAEVIFIGGFSRGSRNAILYAEYIGELEGVLVVGPGMLMPDKIASLDVPLLWIRGSYDNIALINSASADYSDAPKHPLNESHLINLYI